VLRASNRSDRTDRAATQAWHHVAERHGPAGFDDRSETEPLKKLMTALAVLSLATAAATPAAAGTRDTATGRKAHAKYGAILPDAYYDGLATCETGTRSKDGKGSVPNWKHSTRSYTGGLGIYRGTAHRWSGRRDLSKLTPKQQVRIADRIAFTGWTRPDGEHVWRVGPWGWGCLKQRASLQAFICASKHRDVQKWKRNCK
jgi:hypothetical protein